MFCPNDVTECAPVEILGAICELARILAAGSGMPGRGAGTASDRPAQYQYSFFGNQSCPGPVELQADRLAWPIGYGKDNVGALVGGSARTAFVDRAHSGSPADRWRPTDRCHDVPSVPSRRRPAIGGRGFSAAPGASWQRYGKWRLRTRSSPRWANIKVSPLHRAAFAKCRIRARCGSSR